MYLMSTFLENYLSRRGSDSEKDSIPPETGNTIVKSEESSKTTDDVPTQEEKRPKPCCCCKETKQKRDVCIVENGAENCTDLIEAHRVCMKGFGYDI